MIRWSAAHDQSLRACESITITTREWHRSQWLRYDSLCCLIIIIVVVVCFGCSDAMMHSSDNLSQTDDQTNGQGCHDEERFVAFLFPSVSYQ